VVVVQEISSLAQQLPEYRWNLEAKIRSLPGVVPGAGVLRRVTSMVQELGRELKQSETEISASSGERSNVGDFTSRAGEAHTGGDPAAGVRTSANLAERRRSIASAAGNGRSDYRLSS
jgi:hypothetical protein